MSAPAERLKPAAAAAATAEPGLDAARVGQWLENACAMVPGVAAGVVVGAVESATAVSCIAHWPRGSALDADLEAIATSVCRGSGDDGISAAAEPGMVFLARRLALAPGAPVVAFKLAQPVDAQRELLLRLVDWSERWFVFAVGAASTAAADVVLDIVRAGLAAADSGRAGTAMAIRLAAALGADDVSIGLLDGDALELAARSQSASFDPRTRANRAIVAAMTEAVFEGQPVIVPATAEEPAVATREHETLRARDDSACVMSVPLVDRERALGAVTIVRQRGAPLSAPERALAAEAADAMAGVVAQRRAAERRLRTHAAEALKARVATVTGAGSRVKRAALCALVALLGLLFVADGTYEIAAPATLEGRVERTLVAPIDGFVAEAPARAGDAVRAGDLLAVIDTRALDFERRRWASERAEAEKTLRQAVAKLDRAEAAINKARLEKASSQLDLIEAQIERSRVVAPFDGIVIAGDLSRSMGAPVSRGDVLFEIAPLDDYRVELEVDERAIADVEVGQTGRLVLTALPHERRTFTIDKIIGVAESGEGQNAFRVEAVVDGDLAHMRPGMHGIGKIGVGERPLIWVWTHALVDRVRLWLWSRLP
ncbi:MAG: HlyD family efflux transporter periplasmic adaptor subunit [Gammaproteobacteria bacterium]